MSRYEGLCPGWYNYDTSNNIGFPKVSRRAVVNYASNNGEEYHQPEFDDVYKVFAAGAAKHGDLNFLAANGSKCSHKDMHDSMFHHLAQSYAGNRLDKETQLDHLLHLITRGLIAYTRIQRGLEHRDDHQHHHSAQNDNSHKDDK